MFVTQLMQWGVVTVWLMIVCISWYLGYRKKSSEGKVFLWTILSITICSLIEVVYDQAFALDYSQKLIYLIPLVKYPMMIPFAYGTFYGLPLSLTVFLMNKVDRKWPNAPKWLIVICMLVGMFTYNMLFEWPMTLAGNSVWVYNMPPWTLNSFFSFGGQPWIVPVTVAVNLPVYYFAHKWALKKTMMMESSVQAFLTNLGAIWASTIFIFISAVIVLTVFGSPH